MFDNYDSQSHLSYVRRIILAEHYLSIGLTTSVNVGGGNYVKLRDLTKALDFYVSYDVKSNTISIGTMKAYVF